MKATKKFLSVFTAFVIILLSVIPAFAVDMVEPTYLYINKGDIVIGDGTVSGYDFYGQPISAPNSNGYCITSSSSEVTEHNIVISGGENYIVLNNVNINIKNDYNCAFLIENGAVVDLFFTGTNIIKSGTSRAGIEISPDSQLTLSGDGTLDSSSDGQAGIGGGSGASNGTVIINSGTITATCTNQGSGIGGGSSGNGGTIIINGGNIVANGGTSGAGIGGGCANAGGNITINGGTVTAVGGNNAAGIGGGWFGKMGNVVINGGSVKAVAGSGALAVGNGAGLSSNTSPVNSDGNNVYLVRMQSPTTEPFVSAFVNGKDCCISGTHPNDKYLYFYIPAGTDFISGVSGDNTVTIYKIDVTQSGGISAQNINPVSAVNGAEIGQDNIIRGITCGLTNLDNYLSVESGYSLSYDNEFIGTGTGVTVMYGDIPIFQYKTLLYGDLNNDGFYNGEDSFIILLFLWRMLNSKTADPLIVEAADVDRNGKITDNDMHILEKAGVYLSSVSQSTGSDTMKGNSFSEYLLLVDQTPLKKEINVNPGEDIIEEPEYIADETTEDASSQEDIHNLLDEIVTFIKNSVKLLKSVVAFLKNYFI